jgi:uncharacterized protein involved in outer membrane biogenesis
LFVTLGGLVVIALFAALIAPRFIDWTAYKQAFEREASRIVGQPVSVAGEANISLLPMPGVTFNALSVGRYDDGQPMMTVESFSMTTELLPFLRGEIRIVEMFMENPRLSIRVNENGTIDWTLRKEMLLDPDSIKLEKLRVENASLVIDGLAGGRQINGTGLDADISAQSLYGPWRIDATGKIDGINANIEISTGRLRPEGEIRVRANSRRLDQPYRLMLDGPISIREDLLDWQGSFEFAAVRAEDNERSQALPVHASGQFRATPQNVAVEQYRLEIGNREDPYTISGTGALNIRERIFFNATAEGRQIDFKRLQGEDEQSADARKLGLQERFATLRDVVDLIPVPQIDGRIDFKLPAIIAGNTVIREVSAVVRPDINGWSISSLRSIFPGNTIVEANGKLGIGDDFGFTGEFVLASRQPTGFANWLSGRSNAPLRRLRNAGLAANVTLTPNQATFEDLELVLDDVSLTGKLQRLAPLGGQPAIIAELSGEEINLDDLQAIYALTQTDDEAANLTDHDLDIGLQAGLLRGQGLEAHNVNAHIRVQDGAISIDRLSAGDFYGTKIVTAGTLSDILGKPSGNFEIEISAEQARQIVALARKTFSENRVLAALASDAQLTRDLSLSVTLDAYPSEHGSRGTLAVNGEIGGTVVSLRNRFEGDFSHWRLAGHELTLKLEQQSPYTLSRQLGLDVLPFDVSGPVTLSSEISGVPDKSLSTVFAVNAPGTDLTASGTIIPGRAGEGIVAQSGFDLEITLGSRNVDPWLQLAGYPLPLMAARTPVSLSLTAHKEKDKFDFHAIDGQYGGTEFSGELALDTAGGGKPRIAGELVLDYLPVMLLGELSLGAGSISQFVAGDIGTFGAPVFAGLDADIGIEARTGDIGALTPASSLSGRLRAVDGVISVPEFKFNWLSGEISGDAAIRNVAGNSAINARIRTTDLEIAEIALLAGFEAPAITGSADVNFTIEGNGRNLQSLIGSLSGSGVLTARKFRLAGISTGGFDTILKRSDAEGFEITPENARRLAKTAMLSGSFASARFSTPFSISRGKTLIRNLNLTDNNGTINLGAEYALLDGSTEFRAQLSLDADTDSLTGAEPEAAFTWQGAAGGMALAIDTTPLEGYLSLRAFEREQRRVEILQARVLENQHLRWEIIEANARRNHRQAQQRRQLEELEDLQRNLQSGQPGQDARTAEPAHEEPETAALPGNTAGSHSTSIGIESSTASIAPVLPQTAIVPLPSPGQQSWNGESPSPDQAAEQEEKPAAQRGLFFNLQKIFESR